MNQSPIDHIILTGSISLDRIMNFNGSYKDLIKPDKLHLISLSILIDTLENSFGGIAANIAYTLALLKEKPVIEGYVGEEVAPYLKLLAKRGVNIVNLKQSTLPTSTFTVLTDNQDNQIGGFYPGAMIDNRKIDLKSWARTNSLVVISANDPIAMRRLVNQALKYKLPYMYDVSQQVSNIDGRDMIAGLQHAHIVIVNDYERAVMAQKTGIPDRKISDAVPVFITTLGEKGSLIEGKTVFSPIKIAALKPIKMIDPTGAGDAYRAGFLFGYKNGYTLEKSGQIGAVTASYAIEKRGTQNHTFSINAFNTRLSKFAKFTI